MFFLNPKLDSVKVASLGVFCLFLLNPLNVFLNNESDFTIDVVSLIVNLFVVSLALSCFISFVLLVFIKKSKDSFFVGVAFLVVASWVMTNFLYGGYGRLDGSELNLSAWSALSVLQAAFILMLVFVLTKLKVMQLVQIVYFVFIASVISNGVTYMGSDDGYSEEHKYEGYPSGLTTLSAGKNVIHIVLDALQVDYFISAMNQEKSWSQLDGFHFFKNTSATYRSTQMSVPMLISGEIYRNKDDSSVFLEKINTKAYGVELLENAGFDFFSHTHCTFVTIDCLPLSSKILKEPVHIKETLQLLDIAIFKMVPDFIKSTIYNDGNWFLLNKSNVNEYLKVPIVGRAHLLFDKFVSEIVVDKNLSRPKYIFFHSGVTHTPAYLDSKCDVSIPEVKLKSEERYQHHVDFVKCGLNHVFNLLDKLKKAGIYDETMVVLSSDHGIGYANDFEKKEFAKMGLKSKVMGYASATLLIKPYFSKGEVVTTGAPAALRDIPLTILSANNVENNKDEDVEFPAVDLFSLSLNSSRQREFLYYVWESKYWKERRLPPITKYYINGDINAASSWTLDD